MAITAREASSYFSKCGRTKTACGHRRRAWAAGARALSAPEQAGTLFAQLYPRRQSEAEGWWMYFRTQYSQAPVAENLQRVADVLPPRSGAAPILASPPLALVRLSRVLSGGPRSTQETQ